MGIAALANSAGTFFSYLVALIATPIIVHSFGNERYGIWSIAISFTGYYGIIDIGIRTTVIKYFSDYNERNDHRSANILLNTTLATFLFIIPIIVAIVAVLVVNIQRIFNIDPAYLDETRILFCITGLNFCFSVFGNTFRAVIVGLRKFTLRNGLLITSSILRSICTILVLKLGYGLIEVAITTLCIDALLNISFMVVVFRLCPYLTISRENIDFKWMKGTYVFAFFNFLRQMSIRIIERSDIVLIGILLDMKTAAFYSIAESLTRYLAKVPKDMRATILPFSSMLNVQERREELQRMAVIIPKYTMSFFLLTLLVTLLFGRQFITLWLGPGYDLSYKLVLILLFAKAVTMSQSMFIHIVVGTGHNRFYGYLGVFEMVLKIVSCVILAKIYGVYGIAFGTLLTVIITSGLFVPIYSAKKIDLNVLDYYLQTVILPVGLCSFLIAVNIYVLKLESLLWTPMIVLEFILLYYFLLWKELKIKGGKLKIRVH